MAADVSADETEALKAEITKAVEKVQEAGKMKDTTSSWREVCTLTDILDDTAWRGPLLIIEVYLK